MLVNLFITIKTKLCIMFSKIEVIDMMLAEYDTEIRNLMKDKLAKLTDDDFNRMIKQAGLKELSKGYYTFKL